MMVIDVTRKGGKRDSVNVAAFAKPYLEQYLAIRDKRYKTEKTDTALFLTMYRGVPNRIDASSVEKMVAKYSEDFKVRVTPTNCVILLQPVSMMQPNPKFWSATSWDMLAHKLPTCIRISLMTNRKMPWIVYKIHNINYVMFQC